MCFLGVLFVSDVVCFLGVLFVSDVVCFLGVVSVSDVVCFLGVVFVSDVVCFVGVVFVSDFCFLGVTVFSKLDDLVLLSTGFEELAFTLSSCFPTSSDLIDDCSIISLERLCVFEGVNEVSFCFELDFEGEALVLSCLFLSS